MCNATPYIVSKVTELMELRKMIDDLTAEAELLTDDIIKDMRTSASEAEQIELQMQ